MTRDEYPWFFANHIWHRCIMGNDYYVNNEHMVDSNGGIAMSGEIFGYYPISRQYFDRYKLPVMHTETNFSDPGSVDWLKKEWANVHRLKLDGVPIVGFTRYGLQDQVDWDTGVRENYGRVNSLGLCGLGSKIRPVCYAYKELIEKWKPALVTEGGVLGPCI
jgi:beta-glucosidase/6-phospho-beta-glucosidase/beta-galactosidase